MTHSESVPVYGPEYDRQQAARQATAGKMAAMVRSSPFTRTESDHVTSATNSRHSRWHDVLPGPGKVDGDFTQPEEEVQEAHAVESQVEDLDNAPIETAVEVATEVLDLAEIDVAGAKTARSDALKAPGDEEEDDLDKLTLQYLDGRAKSIAATLRKHEGSKDPEAGYNAVKEKYINVEGIDPRLQKFAQLINLAPRVYQTNKVLDDFETQVGRGEDLTVEDRELRRRSVRLACGFNILLGSLVEEAEEAMPPGKLLEWLNDAVGGDLEWVKRIVVGLQPEQAGRKLLLGVDGITNVMHGDVDQDLEGKDLIFDTTPSGYSSVDVKRRKLEGGVMPITVVPNKLEVVRTAKKAGVQLVLTPANSHLELNIDPRHLDESGYALQPDKVMFYQKCLQKVLIEKKSLDTDTEEGMETLEEIAAELRAEEELRKASH